MYYGTHPQGWGGQYSCLIMEIYENESNRIAGHKGDGDNQESI